VKRPLKGLFLNTGEAVCSIYESGRMCYESLCLSESYTLDYIELSSENREIDLSYDFYVFNYHFVRMEWLDTQYVKRLPGFKMTIVLEVSPNDPFACVSQDDFDAYIVLDPTCEHPQQNAYAFSRPLDRPLDSVLKYDNKTVPVIGTFGLSFSDKGFDEVVEAVDKEFDEALIRINIPESEHVSQKEFDDYSKYLKSLSTKDKVRVETTRHYFDKDGLINWCAENTLNIFLYNRRIGNGLSATTDQAISSGRPLAVSTNPTFRHIHRYITPYPYWSLKKTIESGAALIGQIQRDWSASNFARQFEMVLEENNVGHLGRQEGKVTLPSLKSPAIKIARLVRRLKFTDFVPPIVQKVVRGLSFLRGDSQNEKIIPEPFLHLALKSYSENQEDFLIDLLLGKDVPGVYVDVTGDKIWSERNTRRLFSFGWHGININPNPRKQSRIAAQRPSDINLPLTISAKPAVDSHSLAAVLGKHLNGNQIDLLSVNVESNSLDILESNDWNKYRPKLVIVATTDEVKDVIRLLDREKYLYVYGNKDNSIFVNKITNDENILKKIVWN
jgi:hypothetical protein